MADTQPGMVSYSLEDSLGSKASVRIPVLVAPAMTVTQAVAVVNTLGGLIDAVTEGEITEGRFEVGLKNSAISGAKASPGADSRVEENGTFNFGNATTSVLQPVTIPSWLDSKLTGDRINTADSDVAALFAFLLAEMTGGGVFTSRDQRAFSALVDTFYSFRKHRGSLSGSKIPYVAP